MGTSYREEIARQTFDVINAAGGAAFLEKSLLAVVGEPLTLEWLATVLFHITQIPKIPKPAMEAIWAIAFLLEEKVNVEMATAVTEQITKDLPNEIATCIVATICCIICYGLLETNRLGLTRIT